MVNRLFFEDNEGCRTAFWLYKCSDRMDKIKSSGFIYFLVAARCDGFHVFSTLKDLALPTTLQNGNPKVGGLFLQT